MKVSCEEKEERVEILGPNRDGSLFESTVASSSRCRELQREQLNWQHPSNPVASAYESEMEVDSFRECRSAKRQSRARRIFQGESSSRLRQVLPLRPCSLGVGVCSRLRRSGRNRLERGQTQSDDVFTTRVYLTPDTVVSTIRTKERLTRSCRQDSHLL